MNKGKLTLTRRSACPHLCAAFLFCTVAAIASSAQTFNVLVSFDGTNGGNPYGPLVQATDGNFYGTTNVKGANGYGTAFEITPDGHLSTLYNFCKQQVCADGGEPMAGLVQGRDGFFYGTTTTGGGQTGDGTLFRMTATGNFSAVYDFGAANFPSTAALVQSPGGDLYGLTAEQAFKMTPKGTLITLHTFKAFGYIPSGLMQSNDRNFYMTTYYGGAHGFGAIYKMTPAGNVTTLYSFCQANCADDNGFYPDATMVQGNDGNLYGTTTEGGTNGSGTVFKIAPAGKITTLYNFCSLANCTDGGYPRGLVQGSDGNFYGVTYYGGNNGGFLSGEGTLYKITPAGQLTTLYSFCSQTNCADGANPYGALMQSTAGTFYGTTLYGGSNASACSLGINGPCGTVFSLSTGLGPFVKLTQDFGSVGHTGGILGQGLTGTTGVFLNGTPASFTVISDTFIEATVPAGATSGFVTVNTPSGTLTSNVPFHVKP